MFDLIECEMINEAGFFGFNLHFYIFFYWKVKSLLRPQESEREIASKGFVHKLRWQDFGFFDHLLTFSTLWTTKRQYLWTTFPPTLVNIVCERSLRDKCCKRDVWNDPLESVLSNNVQYTSWALKDMRRRIWQFLYSPIYWA